MNNQTALQAVHLAFQELSNATVDSITGETWLTTAATHLYTELVRQGPNSGIPADLRARITSHVTAIRDYKVTLLETAANFSSELEALIDASFSTPALPRQRPNKKQRTDHSDNAGQTVRQ